MTRQTPTIGREKTGRALRTGTRLLQAGSLSLCFGFGLCGSASGQHSVLFTSRAGAIAIVHGGRTLPILVERASPAAVLLAAQALAGDVQRVSGSKPLLLRSMPSHAPKELLIAGVLGQSTMIDQLCRSGKLHPEAVQGKWESSMTAVVEDPLPGVRKALVVAGSDRRGVAYALLQLSRQMGVSPWVWWADVPVKHHSEVWAQGTEVQGEPSVRYRGIFLNDEDWGLRPWAAAKMDPQLGNIGPNTYLRVFELLIRLRANTLWPAMHPGTLPFNAVPANAINADRWGIVMGSSHSEALLRNNVGEWNEKTDGPWNYQVNQLAMDAYWKKRLEANGQFENFYTVGLRGVHDTGLEATGTVQDKARLVERVMQSQRTLLAQQVRPKLDDIPQVIWLYKESLDLYRAGMRVPNYVTLGWTDDNYGYIRQLPTNAEAKRSGGSAVYYHVSYWGFPHDYLWLCSTPPALMREELTKAFDHDARRLWILNVGDLKPAEMDIDYFMQLAWDEPDMAAVKQRTFLRTWFGEQFPPEFSARIAAVMNAYYQLNFVRKPEFMGFNGYNDRIRRTAFNPLAWGDENLQRRAAWEHISAQAVTIGKQLPAQYQDAYFELVGYPVEAAAAQNAKFLWMDRAFLAAAERQPNKGAHPRAHAAFEQVQALTAYYNNLKGGKWRGMMSAFPRDRQVFLMPAAPTVADIGAPLPASWKSGNVFAESATDAPFVERDETVSINASHFAAKSNTGDVSWHVLEDLGVSGASMVYGNPGKVSEEPGNPDPARVPWLEYRFTTASTQDATLTLDLLPTFPVDADHALRFAISVDGGPHHVVDAGSTGKWAENSAPVWETNVLRNYSALSVPLGPLTPGLHRLRWSPLDPGLVLQQLQVTWPGAPPAYPVPPETR